MYREKVTVNCSHNIWAEAKLTGGAVCAVHPYGQPWWGGALSTQT